MNKFDVSVGNGKIVYISNIGSVLYGTNSENSDSDYAGIFMPSMEEVITQTFLEQYKFDTNNKNTKNNKDDIDFKIISVYEFFNLLKGGDTGALDLMFSMFRSDTIEIEDDTFVTLIKDNYKSLISKEAKSFIGYCKNQASKYGLKGKNFETISIVYEAMNNFIDTCYQLNLDLKNLKLKDFIDSESFNIVREQTDVKITLTDGVEYFTFSGKQLQLNAPFLIYSAMIAKTFNSFGSRTKAAMEAGGIDWKAVSHAVRVADELNELLTTGFITFPLANSAFIKSVKLGQVDIETVLLYLEEALENSNTNSEKSSLPSTVDEDFVNNLLLTLYAKIS
jgi:hypothetical protein